MNERESVTADSGDDNSILREGSKLYANKINNLDEMASCRHSLPRKINIE